MMDDKVDWNDATSTTMTNPLKEEHTPTHTVATDDLEGDINDTDLSGVEAVPWAGDTFVIRHRDSGRAIAVNEDGDIQLMFFHEVGTSQSCHWKCMEKDGWFGFKHEGRYLGHDNNWGFHAEVKHHKGHEYFCARKHPDGGYQLMTVHGWMLRKMDIGQDGQKLVETTNKG
ncbi:MAG: hypothetical protein LQ340_007411, partial [Diploschistes diacapsis]